MGLLKRPCNCLAINTKPHEFTQPDVFGHVKWDADMTKHGSRPLESLPTSMTNSQRFKQM